MGAASWGAGSLFAAAILSNLPISNSASKLANVDEAACVVLQPGALSAPPGPDCDACAAGGAVQLDQLSDNTTYNRCFGCCIGMNPSYSKCCSGSCCGVAVPAQAAAPATPVPTGILNCGTGCVENLGHSWHLTATLITYALALQGIMIIVAFATDRIVDYCKQKANGRGNQHGPASVGDAAMHQNICRVHGGEWRDFYILICSVLTCALFVMRTYWRGVTHWMTVLDLILGATYVVDYAVFYCYEPKESYLKFVLQTSRIIDVICIASAFGSDYMWLWNFDSTYQGTWLGLTCAMPCSSLF